MNSGSPPAKGSGGVPEWLNGAVSKTPRPPAGSLKNIPAASRQNASHAGESPRFSPRAKQGSRPPETADEARASSARPAQPPPSRGARRHLYALPTVTEDSPLGVSRSGTASAEDYATVSHTVPESSEEMHGFEEPDGAVAEPAVDVSPETREKLVHVLASLVSGATPEEITVFLTDGWPAHVEELLSRPHEAEEMSDHVDVLLSTLQAPALSAA